MLRKENSSSLRTALPGETAGFTSYAHTDINLLEQLTSRWAELLQPLFGSLQQAVQTRSSPEVAALGSGHLSFHSAPYHHVRTTHDALYGSHLSALHHRGSQIPASLPHALLQFHYGNEAGAAWNALASGVNSGVTLAGALGSAETGFALGGPLGAVAGLGLNLLGGLFHHHSDPLANSKQYDPALYNSPSGMDYSAYRYRESASLALPAGTQAGQYGLAWWQMPGVTPPQQAPAVHVYVDGVQQALQNQISSATSAGAASRTSAWYDMQRPV